MADAPRIIVCLPETERQLGAQIVQGLTARGLRVLLASDAAQLQHPPAFSALCVGITARKQHASLVEAAIIIAKEVQRPILPLRIDVQGDVPLALQETQWSDFTQGFALGWHALLLALDMEGLSRWPYESSTFDPDVILVRAQNGLTRPDWQVYRRPSRFYRSITRESFAGAALVIVLSLLALIIDWTVKIDQYGDIYLSVGVVLAVLFLRAYRDSTSEITKYGPLIVLTPQGFLINEPARFASYSFAELRSVQIQELKAIEHLSVKQGASARANRVLGTSLAIVQVDGTRKTVMIPATFNFQPGRPPGTITQVIAAQIIVAFQQAQKNGSSNQPNEHKPLIFLSYARTNPRVVDSAEMGLRDCGLQPWVDRSQLVTGTKWKQEIRAALQECSALVLFLSPDALRSRNVRFEYTTALQLGKPIIGVKVQFCWSIPAELRPYVCADMRRDRYLGLLQALFALERAAALPEEITRYRENAPMYVLARGLMRAPRADEQVFYPSKWTRGDQGLLMFIAGLIAVEGILNHVFLPVLYVSALVYLSWSLHGSRVLGHVPEMLIIHPTGVVRRLFRHETSTAFAELDDLVIQGSSWLSGTAVIGHHRDTERRIVLSLPAHLRGHHKIAQLMVEAFKRSPR